MWTSFRAPDLWRAARCALVLLPVLVLSACGGETGGAPSGIAGSLTNVEFQITSFVATTGAPNAEDKIFVPTLNSKSGQVTIKGGGTDREDLVFRFDLNRSSSSGRQIETSPKWPVRTGDRDVLVQYFDQPKVVVESFAAGHQVSPNPRVTNGYLFKTKIAPGSSEIVLRLEAVLNDPNSAVVRSGKFPVSIGALPAKTQSVVVSVTEEPAGSDMPVVVATTFGMTDLTEVPGGETVPASKKLVDKLVWFPNRQRRLTVRAKAFAGPAGTGLELGRIDGNKSVEVIPDADAEFDSTELANLAACQLEQSIDRFYIYKRDGAGNPTSALEDGVTLPSASYPSTFTMVVKAKLYGEGAAVDVPNELFEAFTENSDPGDYIGATGAAGTFEVKKEGVPSAAEQPSVKFTFNNGIKPVTDSMRVTILSNVGGPTRLTLAATDKAGGEVLKGAYLKFEVQEEDLAGSGPGATTHFDAATARTATKNVVNRNREFTITGRLYAGANGHLLLAEKSVADVALDGTTKTVEFDSASNKVTAVSGLLVGGVDAATSEVVVNRRENLATATATVSGLRVTLNSGSASLPASFLADAKVLTKAEAAAEGLNVTDYATDGDLSIAKGVLYAQGKSPVKRKAAVKITYRGTGGFEKSMFVFIYLKANQGNIGGGIG